jgi:hypothetical protein
MIQSNGRVAVQLISSKNSSNPENREDAVLPPGPSHGLGKNQLSSSSKMGEGVMFGSTVLDLAVGLIFTFLMVSLITSATTRRSPLR